MRSIEDTEAVGALARTIIEIKDKLKKAEQDYKEAIAKDEQALEEAQQALLEWMAAENLPSLDVAPYPEIPQQLWRVERRSNKIRVYDPASVYRALGSEGFQLMRVSAPAVDQLRDKLPEEKWQQIHEGYTEKESEPWIAITLKRVPRGR